MRLSNPNSVFLCLIGCLAVGATPAAAQPAPSVSWGPTIQVTGRTVLVDVLVADHKGQPVAGLKKEDFTILDDGKPQPISYFEVHGGAQTFVATAPRLPEGMVSNIPTEVKTDAVDVVLLDSLNTPTQDQMRVRKELISYLNAIPPGTRIAIFTLSSHLRMINGFTTDPTALLDTLNQKGTIQGVDISPLIDPDQMQEQVHRQDQMLTTANLGNTTGTADQKTLVLGAVNQLRQFETDQETFTDDLRVKMTLHALDQVSRYLNPLPGRKNLIWFSASFPIGIDPDFNQADAYRNLRDYAMDIRATAERLAAARVAVYPIDARRFFQNPVLAASYGGESSLRNGQYNTDAADLAWNQVVKEHDTMDEIAEDTGGRAIYNTGDLKGAMAGVISNGDRYYTLAFDPQQMKQDGKFHKITVKSVPGTTLLYRHGYVALDAAKVKPGSSDGNQNADQNSRAKTMFRSEMEPGGPPASDLMFCLQSVREDQDRQPKAADKLKGDNGALKRPVTRYVFGYQLGLHAAQMTQTPDGLHHGLLLAMVIAYDQQGRALNSVLNTESLALDPKVYADSLKQGLPFYQELDIPPGDATIRVGIYDVSSGKIGAMEFPLKVESAPAK